DRQTVWNPEKGKSDAPTRFGSSIASQPLIPGQAGMCALSPRDRRRRRCIVSLEGRFRLDFQMLAMQTEARSPLVPSVPVPPKKRSRSHRKRMEQHTHLARFVRGAAIPLAFLAQQTWTASTNAGPIDHAQTAIGFSAVFMRQ